MIFEDKQITRTSVGFEGPTLLGFNAAQDEHQNTVCPTHPESSDRIQKIKEALKKAKIFEKCQVLTEFLEIDNGDLEITHEKAMVQELMETENKTQEEINSQCEKYDSVFLTENSMKVAKDGVACVRELTNRIMANQASNGFAVIRPPGHHADASTPCGFCVFNNVAQATEEAMASGAERVLIVDLDVHHGQGTQRIFYEEKKVLYFSIHRYEHGLYWPHLPESNFDHVGAGGGAGYNANVPLNETGCTDSDYLSILFHVLLPLATQFDPHFVIVSAGFDSLIGDPIGGMCLTPDGYSHFIYHLKSLAQGRLLAVLEGGYNHQMSAVAVQKCVRVLLGYAPYPVDLDEPAKESTVASCVNLVTVLRNYWTCFDYFPSRTSLRLAQWPVINSNVEFKYDSSSRPPNTGEVAQAKLQSMKLTNADELPSENMETLIYFNEGDEGHYDLEEEDRHPEKPARTQRILKTLRESGVLDLCTEKNIERMATDDEIRMVHTKKMLDHLKTTETMKEEELMEEAQREFNSIFLTKETLKVARKAVGTVLQSVDDVFKKSTGQRNAFVIVRPPGHHASSSKPSGFCIFNNVAIAAKYAQRRYKAKRILILDWDVHHGNGTQEIFYEDKNVMYMSLHRHDKGVFYPMGEPKDYFDVGEGDGEGMSVNVPFSGAAMGDAEYQMAFQRVILPIAYQFQPDLVLISAGFDAAVDDPLGEYKVTPETFALMTYQLSSLASGRVIAVLEGGYNLDSISNSALAVCTVLQTRSVFRRLRAEKEQFASVPPKMESSSIRSIRQVCETQQKYWHILKGFQVTPSDLGLDFEDESIFESVEMSEQTPSESPSLSPPESPALPQSNSPSPLTPPAGIQIESPILPPPEPMLMSPIKPPTVVQTETPIVPPPEPMLMSLTNAPTVIETETPIVPPPEPMLMSPIKPPTVVQTDTPIVPPPEPMLMSPIKSSTVVQTETPIVPPPEPMLMSPIKTPTMVQTEIPIVPQPTESVPMSPIEAPTVPASDSPTLPSNECFGLNVVAIPSESPALPSNGCVDQNVDGVSPDSPTEQFSQSSHPDLEFLSSGAAHAVHPLSWCPHLVEVQPVPPSGIDAHSRCSECQIEAEVWVCLTCYQYNCGRFVNEHAVMHNFCTSHSMALSMSELSVWCYPCESYVHHPDLIPVKSSGHMSKFNETMPS